MTERARFVFEWERELKEDGRVNMAALCRAFQVSRQTGYKWVARYLKSGRRFSVLEDRSRRPKRSPAKISAKVEAALVRARRMHSDWGARKLRDWILRLGARRIWIRKSDVPSASTIGAVLRRNGLTRPRPARKRTPPYSVPLAHCTAPNAVWCVDFKGWFRTMDGSVCYPFTLMDAFSRKLLRCEVVGAQDHQHVRPIFEAAFREFGLPDAIRSDNGPPFATKSLGGFSELSVWWAQLRIQHERITPGKPQENGRHERMHRTLKEATTIPPAQTLKAQQRLFDEFRLSYNEERPHEALDGASPDDLYAASARRFPKKITPLAYPHDVEVRTVSPRGVVEVRHLKVRVGSVFARKELGFRPVGAWRWELLYGSTTLGILDLQRNKIIGPKRKRRNGPAENVW